MTNILKDGTEYIQDSEDDTLLEVTFKRAPKPGETDCDVCNVGDGEHCKSCDYQHLLPEEMVKRK